MRPHDLSEYATISDPQLHPDGVRVAFVVSRMNFDDDRYDRSIWLWDGSESRPFTHGPVDAGPRWSPNGDHLAFLRASGEPGTGAQVAVMTASGGEARVVTDFDIGASEAEWSPTGDRLAVVGETWHGEWADLDEDDRKSQPRRIRGPRWRFDNLGYLHDREKSIWLVELEGGEARQLTTGERADGVSWRPDGAAIGFLSSRHERAGFDSANQAWEVDVESGSLEALVEPGMWANVSYAPDGTAHILGIEDASSYPDVFGLFRLDDGGPVRLAAEFDRNLLSPAPATAPLGPQWLDSGACRIIAEDRGSLTVVEIAADGSVHEVAGGRRLITGMTVRGDGSAMALASTSMTDPGELHWFEDGDDRAVTDLNSTFRASGDLVEPEHFLVTSGDTELDAWVFLPPGSERVPVLFNIHGGPATQYGWGFFDEFQVYVGAGYGVVATNPRGSSGRGADFVKTPVGRWGEDRPPDLEDLLTVYDAALERFDRLDGDRAGIMGGSYGGFMTTRILAVDDRWSSAVPERGLYNFVSFAGTSDIGFSFPARYLGDWDYDDWSALWDASPLRGAHRISAPCLVIHSDADYRCPIEQGEQLFSALIDNGVEAELLRFPAESHELSRSGKPMHRRQRFEAILEWHDRHLG